MKKLISVAVVVALLVPASALAKGGPKREAAKVCAPIPVTIDTVSVKVQGQSVRVGGRSQTQVCVSHDTQVNVGPVTNFGQNCGIICFAVRLDSVRVYEDLHVEILWREDGQWKSVIVDPDPVDASQGGSTTCISMHAEGTPDPCA